MIKKQQKDFEFEGRTVEDAIQRAIKELSVSREDIIVKVVCEEKKGLFGMDGAKPAKIKVSFEKKDNKA